MSSKIYMDTEGHLFNNPVGEAFCKIYRCDKPKYTAMKHDMRVPPDFRRFMVEKPPCDVVFVDMSNRKWNVKLEKRGDDLVFTEGWVEFREGNELGHGDFLLFNHLTEGLFHVEIFDMTTCHKTKETTAAILASRMADLET